MKVKTIIKNIIYLLCFPSFFGLLYILRGVEGALFGEAFNIFFNLELVTDSDAGFTAIGGLSIWLILFDLIALTRFAYRDIKAVSISKYRQDVVLNLILMIIGFLVNTGIFIFYYIYLSHTPYNDAMEIAWWVFGIHCIAFLFMLIRFIKYLVHGLYKRISFLGILWIIAGPIGWILWYISLFLFSPDTKTYIACEKCGQFCVYKKQCSIASSRSYTDTWKSREKVAELETSSGRHVADVYEDVEHSRDYTVETYNYCREYNCSCGYQGEKGVGKIKEFFLDLFADKIPLIGSYDWDWLDWLIL